MNHTIQSYQQRLSFDRNVTHATPLQIYNHNTKKKTSSGSCLSESSNSSILPFLDQVELTIAATPGRKSFLNLLRLESPNLRMADIVSSDETDRLRAIKLLKVRIHPDKYPDPKGHEHATVLFQKVQVFIEACDEISKAGESNDALARKLAQYGIGNNHAGLRRHTSEPIPMKQKNWSRVGPLSAATTTIQRRQQPILQPPG